MNAGQDTPRGISFDRSTARGELRFSQDRCSYRVYDSEGKVVFEDSTGKQGWKNLLEQLNETVTALRVVENAGHRLYYSWREVVDTFSQHH